MEKKNLTYWLKIAGIGIGLGLFYGLAALTIFSMFMVAILMVLAVWMG